jgi:hypothetical protein
LVAGLLEAAVDLSWHKVDPYLVRRWQRREPRDPRESSIDFGCHEAARRVESENERDLRRRVGSQVYDDREASTLRGRPKAEREAWSK